jgi:hypothetical protein
MEGVIRKAKKFAEDNNISLSRLTEMLLRKVTSGNYQNLADLPVADWVKLIAEGEVEYRKRGRKRKSMKEEYFKSKK